MSGRNTAKAALVIHSRTLIQSRDAKAGRNMSKVVDERTILLHQTTRRPVTVLTAFVGSGKAALLNQVLKPTMGYALQS